MDSVDHPLRDLPAAGKEVIRGGGQQFHLFINECFTIEKIEKVFDAEKMKEEILIWKFNLEFSPQLRYSFVKKKIIIIIKMNLIYYKGTQY